MLINPPIVCLECKTVHSNSYVWAHNLNTSRLMLRGAQPHSSLLSICKKETWVCDWEGSYGVPQGLCGGHLLYCAGITMLCYKAKAQEGVTSKHLHYEHVPIPLPSYFRRTKVTFTHFGSNYILMQTQEHLYLITIILQYVLWPIPVAPAV